jgi:hypothetical protein
MATFTVRWTNFTVLKKHDIDRDKPYLWVFGIVVDATSMASGNYVIRKPSTSDNLGKKFKKGDSVTVSGSLDISRQVTPILGKATAGVVVVAWENATTKDSVIADAYANAADTIDEFVGDLVKKKFEELVAALEDGESIDSLDLKPTDAELAALRSDVEDEIRRTIREGSTLFQAIHDHNIGTSQTLVSLDEPFEQCLDYRFVNGSTDYNLEGDLAYGDPAPPAGTVTEPDVGNIPIKHQEPKPTSTLRPGR